MKSIVTLVALAIMASPSFAATNKKMNKSNAPVVNTDNNDNTNVNTYTSNKSNSAINWNAGLGLGSAGSLFHFGVMVNGMVPVANMEAGDILVGGQTGFLYGPGTVSTWIIPIMANGQFNFKGNGKITPYAGLGMGLSIFHSPGVTLPTILGGTTVGGGTTTNFALLAKGGLYFGEEQNYYAELPLGTMGNSFAIFPSVGMKF